MLLGLLLEMTGLVVGEDDPSDWPARSVRLPAGWSAITRERLWIRGRPVRLTAKAGSERAHLGVLEDRRVRSAI